MTKTVGGKETNVPEKKPKKMQNARTPARELTLIKDMTRMPEIMPQGTIMLRGPILSASMFGKMRPKIEAPLMMGRM